MAIEIERKFLVISHAWQHSATIGVHCLQGYIAETENAIIRIRIYGPRGFFAVKAIKGGISRFEYEYEIPFPDAELMLAKLCRKPLIDKMRHELIYEGHRWEIDVFSGLNEGLTIAEIELSHEEEAFSKPPWTGSEVTDDPRYLNVNLARFPYRMWSPSD